MMPTFFSVKKFQFFEQLQVIKKFYNARLFAIDALLFFFYLYKNPFQMAKKKERGNIYGETPLTFYDKMALNTKVKEGDIFLEIGSGRGRGALFMAERYRCKVVGVEWVPLFVKKARLIRNLVSLEKVEFIEADFLEVDLSKADVIYIYGTCFSDDLIQKLLKKFKSLKKGLIVITVSYSLSEYDAESFSLIKSEKQAFPWGYTDVFYNLKN